MGIRGGSVDVRGSFVAMMSTLTFSTSVFGVAWVEPVHAETCSALTERVRKDEPGGLGLPDCRAYEQVSPVAKNGLDALGGPYSTRAALTDGGTTGGGVSFYSLVPFPGVVGSATPVPTYLSRPEAGGWLTEGLQPPAAAETASGDVQLGLTEDLKKTILFAKDPPLALGATPGVLNAYVRDNTTRSYQLLAPSMGPPNEIGFVAAASGDSRILFETNAPVSTSNLLPVAGVMNLYEWNEGMPVGDRLSLAGLVPPGAEPACGGPQEPACEAASQGSRGGPKNGAIRNGQGDLSYTQRAISSDGSRVFFTDVATGSVFMREPTAGRTVRVSAGVVLAEWLGATPSGSFVFYTQGPELYRFNTAENKREALTSGGEGVLGLLGVSDDASYAYFVAHGVLATNKNANKEEAVKGAPNLYVWHQGVTTFIAQMTQQDNWQGFASFDNGNHTPADGNKSSRVTPDGTTVLFSSNAQLTKYNSNGYTEFYLYSADAPLSVTNPVCVSCNPRGVAATSETRLGEEDLTAPTRPTAATVYLTHNLSDFGSRVFFQSEEALVPEDTNGTLDVYEWERVGAGSCEATSVRFSAQDGGCLYLISTGQSPQVSFFGDADAKGENVFFFTRQSLVGQDQDENIDLYDARVRGGIAAQNPPASAAVCAEESACRGPSSNISPVFGTPSSTTFSGTGNLPEQAPVPPTKILTRAEKLAKALRACRSKPRSKRNGCDAAARRRYGPKPKTKKADRGRGRHS
jgi:hypothetical protein